MQSDTPGEAGGFMSVTASKAVVLLDKLTEMPKLSGQPAGSKLAGCVASVLLAHVSLHRFQLKPNPVETVYPRAHNCSPTPSRSTTAPSKYWATTR